MSRGAARRCNPCHRRNNDHTQQLMERWEPPRIDQGLVRDNCFVWFLCLCINEITRSLESAGSAMKVEEMGAVLHE